MTSPKTKLSFKGLIQMMVLGNTYFLAKPIASRNIFIWASAQEIAKLSGQKAENVEENQQEKKVDLNKNKAALTSWFSENEMLKEVAPDESSGGLFGIIEAVELFDIALVKDDKQKIWLWKFGIKIIFKDQDGLQGIGFGDFFRIKEFRLEVYNTEDMGENALAQKQKVDELEDSISSAKKALVDYLDGNDKIKEIIQLKKEAG